jgi:putative membrane protein
MQVQNLAVVVVVAIIVVFAVLLVGGIGMAGAGMMGVGMMGGMGLGLALMGGLLMLGVPVLFVVGLVWLAVSLGRGSGSPLQTSGPAGISQQAPLDVLKLRYARGEITKEQFDEMRQQLAS